MSDRAGILLVDDRPENLFALEAILEPLGHDLVRASSGPEALRQVLIRDFAVILLDVQMPGMNGFETAHLIKSRERSRHIPIIFLTAISKDEEYVFEGYSAGAVDYMFKPFNPDILRSKVSVFVDLYLKTRELERQAELLRESERREMELRHHSQLQESEARCAEIVGSAMEAILTFGDDHRIVLFNTAATRTFGYPAEEALQTTVDRLFRPPLDAETLERLCGGAANSPQGEEMVGVRSNGEEFPVEVSVSCLQLADERVYTVIARDVSERRRADEALRSQALSLEKTSHELRRVNEELSRRQQELEEAMTARSRFYASMSHELRTPINAIMGYTALLLDDIYGPLNEKQTNGIERTHKAAHHLLDLVNDILDLSKIEAGKIELQLEAVGFPELVRDLFVTVAPLAEQHSTSLALEEEADPFTIVSDPRRVRQILLNLLSNAIKFGEGKPIRVVVRRTDADGVEVEVIDQGLGIAEEDQLRIFDEFVQLERINPSQGTGLGLPISRRLAVLLGGSLTVESAVDEGSTFRLVLPADPDLVVDEHADEPAHASG